MVNSKLNFSDEIADVLKSCKGVTIPKTREDLLALALGGSIKNDSFEVTYDVEGKPYTEANVVRCKNAAVVNYTTDYMRRRDPDCLVVADDGPTDKPRYKDQYGKDFSELRALSLEWLKGQELIVVPFMAGGNTYGYKAALIGPKNAAFFACGLSDLQCFINIDEYAEDKFDPVMIIFLAPVFRHTHFSGKQIVVHNRLPNMYEMFSYNLYPGPSAKKGVYGFLLHAGEKEGWLTTHASAVKLITPYDNEIVIMHEGASGGGKSEMGEQIHREPGGQILYGQKVLSGERFTIHLSEPCELRPIADDMALCHTKMQNKSGKLVIQDAESGWFLRLDHIKEYGTEPHHEKLCTHPKEPLVFMNIQGVPNSTALIWEHTIDSNGKPCPNPRVIMPRRMIPGVISGPTEVDVRSFGVRTPPCTRDRPTYGIIGMMQVIPPALAWLWRLVAPRGHNNPSIVETEGMTSEGVGSFGPFLTGKITTAANLLLEQIVNSPNVSYVIFPNQHIGCYKVSFMPQWISREYIARRGSTKFAPSQLVPARLPLLGYCLKTLKVDGRIIRDSLLRPEMQREVGTDGYDAGAKMLVDFFKRELKTYDYDAFSPLGKKIVDLVMNDAGLEEYVSAIPH
jgi:hypothetical protein